MQGLLTPQPAFACGPRQNTGKPARFSSRPSQHASTRREGREAEFSVRAMQRAQSPSRSHTFDRLSAPEAGPSVSAHPDAIRSRQEAENRRQSRQEYVQATAAGKGWWEVQNPTNMHLITSPEEFKERVRLAKGENTLVVVDYFAPWCHACKSLHPKVQDLAKSYRDVTFLSVNAGVDSLKSMCDEIGIVKLPYFHFLKGEQGIVAEFAANLTAQRLQQLRSQVVHHRAN